MDNLSDQEKQELISKGKNSYEFENVEKEISNKISEIGSHRIEKEGKCWFFSIKEFIHDYGSIWSDPSYWKILTKSNKVDEKFCLFSFQFQKTKDACDICKERIEYLESLYTKYLKNLRNTHNLED